ncbi:MAG: nucleotide exchange factor GrpE [Candidatus Aminicenantes bacterium]|jgi:molecular chaperone GrpE (heat shock protein)
MARNKRKKAADETKRIHPNQGEAEARLLFEENTLSLLKTSLEEQRDIKKKLDQLAERNPILEQIIDLSNTVYTHSNQLKQSEEKLLGELKKFQLEKPQRAMFSIFNKLFRDLLSHMNHMDELLKDEKITGKSENELAWIKALKVLCGHLESILREWGCFPMAVKEGEEQFDPEIHEAVKAIGEEIESSLPENIIVKVRRRGWKLHDQILQYPQVVVS